jgi:hypothetical protein
MCTSKILKVISIDSKLAVLEDGRTVHLGSLSAVSSGDYLEVYADIAVSKVSRKSAVSIQSTRRLYEVGN